MKKIFTILFLSFLLFVTFNMVFAQNVKIKIEAMSSNMIANRLKIPRSYISQNQWMTSGLPTVGVKTKVFLSGINGGTWTVSGPGGSTATINQEVDSLVSLIPDMKGAFIVTLTSGTKSDKDTIYAGVYSGMGSITTKDVDVVDSALVQNLECANKACHGGPGASFVWQTIIPEWGHTHHATMFYRGVTGQLEFVQQYDSLTAYGASYSKTCTPCHTTGYNSGPTNTGSGADGFYDQWKANGFKYPDSTQSKMFDYYGSMWNPMPRKQKQLGTIGCEECHGPYTDQHNGTFFLQNMVTHDYKVCAQCHDAPDHHAVVREYETSNHFTQPVARMETAWATQANNSCLQCHSGEGFFKYQKSKQPYPWKTKTAVSYATTDYLTPISCTVCHDPHDGTKLHQVNLFTTTGPNPYVDTLVNGVKITAGGAGQICMYCHRSRTNPLNLKPSNYPRIDPHHGPQTDMLMGQNGYEFADKYKKPINGLETHLGLEAGCATCHMYVNTLASGYPLVGGHTFKMDGPKSSKDTTIVDNVAACKDCHGTITKFEDIKASDDYDGNGIIEGVMVEVQGMLTKLENKMVNDWKLTRDPATGNVILRDIRGTDGNRTPESKADSTIITTGDNLKIFYNYSYFINDRSMGVHNAKYAIQLLGRTLTAAGLAKVEQFDNKTPLAYSLSPNYPNPFNPTTNINFTIPKDGYVKIYIYNTVGELVATIIDSYFIAGNYSATWDGKTSSGLMAASGTYFYKMVSKDFVQSKKMMLMK